MGHPALKWALCLGLLSLYLSGCSTGSSDIDGTIETSSTTAQINGIPSGTYAVSPVVSVTVPPERTSTSAVPTARAHGVPDEEPSQVQSLKATSAYEAIPEPASQEQVFESRTPPEYAAIAPNNAGQLTQISEIQFEPWDLVMAIAWSPDSRHLAVSSGDRLRLVGVPSMTELASTSVGAFTHSLAYRQDGSQLASGSRDGFLRIWEISSPGEGADQQNELVLTMEIGAHKKGVNTVAFDPSGELLASGGNDAVARLWDARSGDILGSLIGGTFAVPALGFVPGESSLAIVNGDVVRLRDIESEAITSSFLGDGSLYSLAFSPDGSLLAAGDISNRIWIWETETAFRAGMEAYPEPLYLFEHHSNLASYLSLVWDIDFDPVGRLLASASGDGFVRLWDVSNGRMVSALGPFAGGVTCVSFDPQGRFLALGGLDRSLRLFGIPVEIGGS